MSCAQLTASIHIRPIAAFLTSHGEPIDSLLEKANLPRTCIENSKTLVPTASLWRFRDLAAEHTGLPNLTMQAMRLRELSELGDVGRSLLGAPTLRRMIVDFQRLSRAESSTTVIGLRPWRGDHEFFFNRFMLKQHQGEWQAELYLLMWMLKMVRTVNPSWTPTEIWCAADETPEHLQAIESLATRPRFNQGCMGFPISAAMLARSNCSDGSASWSPKPGDSILCSTSPALSVAGAVGQMISAYADDRWLTIDQASEALGTSSRTLQRQLAADGTSYSETLEEIRSEKASELLRSTDASLFTIAEHLGYSNLSNFNRAFLRWAAVSPREFRRQGRESASERR